MPSLDPSFRPLEYWKPPKAVRHHTRAKSSAIFSPGGAIRSFTSNHSDKGEKSLATKTTAKFGIDEMSSWPKNQYSEGVNMASRGQPPAYRIDDEDTLNPRWYDVREWGKKVFIGIGAAVVIIIIIIVVAVVEVEKANRYPDYSALSYSLSETYSGTGFFDQFDYFTGYDPSSGFVHYVPSAQAESLNLTYAGASSAVLRVDTSVTADSVPNASTGRFSVRVSSKNQYGLNSLFIFDVIHTPIGCATWPALWLADESNWPYNGEIDIMEAVNVVSNVQNQMTLHTSSGCSMGVKRKETGTSLQNSCVNTTNDNAGCGVHAPTSIASFGDDFNNNGGGVMALELRAAGIRLWQFPRASIPSDVTSGTPDPSTWGEATADYPNTDCNIETHFKNQSIIANIDLCGSWAGATSIYDASCPGLCTDYVANNATAFTDSYWEFGAFNIYSGS